MTARDQGVKGGRTPGPQATEYAARFLPGLRMLALGIVIVIAGVVLAVVAAHLSGAAAIGVWVVCALVLLAGVLVLRGLTAVVPGRARVVQLFGRYRGTIRESGLKWVNPFTDRIVISTRSGTWSRRSSRSTTRTATR